MKMLAEAKQEAEAFRANEMQKAREDAAKMLESAKSEIETQKNAALNEVKKEVANLSISIAEKLVKEKLQANEAQDNLIKSMIASSN
jgi:F-type H+-transporting ATPase subunit b